MSIEQFWVHDDIILLRRNYVQENGYSITSFFVV